MNILVVVFAVSVGAGCSTTVGALQSPATDRWLADHRSSEALIVSRPEPGAETMTEQRGVLLDSSSSSDVRFESAAGAELGVPMVQLRQITVVKRARGAGEGALIGVATGVLVGVSVALIRGQSDFDRSSDCNFLCSTDAKATYTGALFGGLGLIVGAALGAVIGHRDVLEF